MSTILHLETATAVCSVALARDGELLVETGVDRGNVHAEQLALFIQRALAEADLQTNDLSAIAVSIGPGSYTGLRVGLSTAKGMAFGLGIPLLAIPTLEALGQALVARTHPAPWRMAMLNSRQAEVYIRVTNAEGQLEQQDQPLVLDATSWQSWAQDHDGDILAGGGWDAQGFGTLAESSPGG